MVDIERLMIPGKGYELKAIYSRPARSSRGTFVLCHPYPPYGGDMFNKVIVKTAEALLEEGFSVLRFNMRDTKRSSEEDADPLQSRNDLEAALHWISNLKGTNDLFLAGYSYGAFIALSSLVPRTPGAFPGRFPIQGILAISYPANRPDFRINSLPELKIRFIHGTDDELIPAASFRLYLNTQAAQDRVHWVNGADHFFNGKLDALMQAIRESLGAGLLI